MTNVELRQPANPVIGIDEDAIWRMVFDVRPAGPGEVHLSVNRRNACGASGSGTWSALKPRADCPLCLAVDGTKWWQWRKRFAIRSHAALLRTLDPATDVRP